MSPKKAKLQGEMNGAGASVPTETEIIKRVSLPTSEDQLRDDLLEGIPNDVTLALIASNLPWRTWQVVSTLSADWQRAFEGRIVYDARVTWQTTQKFFVVLCELCTEAKIYDSQHQIYIEIPLKKRTLSLFSPSEERWFRLPPLPGCHSGLPDHYNYVFLDGAVYNLGGTRNDISRIPSKELHVLDLARHPLEWRQCASMQAQRRDLRNIGVMHGKIFVFAGWSEDGRNEAYDPKVDAWSWIAPIRPWEQVCSVFSVGQQFFVFRGCTARSRPGNPAGREPVRDEETEDSKLMADLYGERKLVVKDGRRGPKLITTKDDDAEDDMDGLHEIIESRLADLDSGRSAVELAERRWDRRFSFPDRDLASEVDFVEEHGHRCRSFLSVYDPVKDKWTSFERESLGTHHVENTQPEITIKLRNGTALVWSMSL